MSIKLSTFKTLGCKKTKIQHLMFALFLTAELSPLHVG